MLIEIIVGALVPIVGLLVGYKVAKRWNKEKQMGTMKMIRSDIDYDALDTEDPQIIKALDAAAKEVKYNTCLLYTSPSPRD